MTKAVGILFIFFVGGLLGYLYSQSRDSNAKKNLEEITDSDYNNKQESVVEKPVAAQNNKVGLPKPRVNLDTKNSGLPKAPILTPQATPNINPDVATHTQKKGMKSSEEINSGAYTITLPGLNGIVKLSTAVVKQAAYRMTPECKKESGEVEIPVESIVADENRGLANAFVSIKEGLNSDAVYSVPVQPVVINQLSCLFSPHVLAVRVGQPVQMLNNDPFLHNVNGMPQINPKFNNGMPTKGSKIEKKFTKAEDMFRLKCDVHPWMSAFIWVVDHPYYSFTDTHGRFAIPDLPYGEYTIQVQHEKLGTREKKVTWGPERAPLEFYF